MYFRSSSAINKAAQEVEEEVWDPIENIDQEDNGSERPGTSGSADLTNENKEVQNGERHEPDQYEGLINNEAPFRRNSTSSLRVRFSKVADGIDQDSIEFCGDETPREFSRRLSLPSNLSSAMRPSSMVNSSNAASNAKYLNGGYLKVDVFQARDIQLKKGNQSRSLYCVLQFGSKKVKTNGSSTVHKPTWNEEFVFFLKYKKGKVVPHPVTVCLHQGKPTKHNLIGLMTLEFSELKMLIDGQSTWFNLVNKDTDAKCGEILLSLYCVTGHQDTKNAQNNIAIETKRPRRGSAMKQSTRITSMRLKNVNKTDDLSHSLNLSLAPAVQSPLPCVEYSENDALKLYLTYVKVFSLIPSLINAAKNCYMVISIGQVEFQTKSAAISSDMTWNQTAVLAEYPYSVSGESKSNELVQFRLFTTNLTESNATLIAAAHTSLCELIKGVKPGWVEFDLNFTSSLEIEKEETANVKVGSIRLGLEAASSAVDMDSTVMTPKNALISKKFEAFFIIHALKDIQEPGKYPWRGYAAISMSSPFVDHYLYKTRVLDIFSEHENVEEKLFLKGITSAAHVSAAYFTVKFFKDEGDLVSIGKAGLSGVVNDQGCLKWVEMDPHGQMCISFHCSGLSLNVEPDLNKKKTISESLTRKIRSWPRNTIHNLQCLIESAHRTKCSSQIDEYEALKLLSSLDLAYLLDIDEMDGLIEYLGSSEKNSSSWWEKLKMAFTDEEDNNGQTKSKKYSDQLSKTVKKLVCKVIESKDTQSCSSPGTLLNSSIYMEKLKSFVSELKANCSRFDEGNSGYILVGNSLNKALVLCGFDGLISPEDTRVLLEEFGLEDISKDENKSSDIRMLHYPSLCRFISIVSKNEESNSCDRLAAEYATNFRERSITKRLQTPRYIVKVICAEDLHTNSSERANAYCVLRIGTEKQRTASIRGTNHPIWNTRMVFDDPRKSTIYECLTITVKNEKALFSEVIGELKIPLTLMQHNKENSFWFGIEKPCHVGVKYLSGKKSTTELGRIFITIKIECEETPMDILAKNSVTITEEEEGNSMHYPRTGTRAGSGWNKHILEALSAISAATLAIPEKDFLKELQQLSLDERHEQLETTDFEQWIKKLGIQLSEAQLLSCESFLCSPEDEKVDIILLCAIVKPNGIAETILRQKAPKNVKERVYEAFCFARKTGIELRSLFLVFDPKNEGIVNLNDFSKICHSIDCKISSRECLVTARDFHAATKNGLVFYRDLMEKILSKNNAKQFWEGSQFEKQGYRQGKRVVQPRAMQRVINLLKSLDSSSKVETMIDSIDEVEPGMIEASNVVHYLEKQTSQVFPEGFFPHRQLVDALKFLTGAPTEHLNTLDIRFLLENLSQRQDTSDDLMRLRTLVEDSLESLSEEFEKHDSTGTGRLPRAEFFKILEKIRVSNSDISDARHELNSNLDPLATGYIDYRQFLEMIYTKPEGAPSSSRLYHKHEKREPFKGIEEKLDTKEKSRLTTNRSILETSNGANNSSLLQQATNIVFRDRLSSLDKECKYLLYRNRKVACRQAAGTHAFSYARITVGWKCTKCGIVNWSSKHLNSCSRCDCLRDSFAEVKTKCLSQSGAVDSKRGRSHKCQKSDQTKNPGKLHEYRDLINKQSDENETKIKHTGQKWKN